MKNFRFFDAVDSFFGSGEIFKVSSIIFVGAKLNYQTHAVEMRIQDIVKYESYGNWTDYQP